MAIKKGLGRNLDALLGTKGPSVDTHSENNGLATLSIDFLQPGKYQPRNTMNAESLADLAASIKAQGIIQPIVVRAINSQRYEILAGERRWRAAKSLGLTEVPVVVRDVPDNAAIAIALIENIQREDLNPIEEATALERLINEFSLTHQEVADAIGRSRTAVSNLLRLMNLAPEVKALLESHSIDMGHARALLSLNPQQQIKVAHQIVSRGMTVRDVENFIQHQQHPKIKSNNHLSPAFLELQNKLSHHVGSKVEIKPGRNAGGKIIFHYKSRQQLDEIATLLSETDFA